MLADRINLNHLRIFAVVYRTSSMTIAAKELHLTQSGISQHVKSLETQLGLKLFDRFKHRLLPTAQATLMYEKISPQLENLEILLNRVLGRENALTGLIKLGVPTEFGNSIVLPLVSEFLQKHPHVQAEIQFGLAPEVNERLLAGAIDFGYVDGFDSDHRIVGHKLFTETHELCASARYMKDLGRVLNQGTFYAKLQFIAYQRGEQILRDWFKHHLRGEVPELNVRAFVESPYSVLQCIRSDLGAGIIPRHLIARYAKDENLYCFRGSGKDLNADVYLVHLYGRSQTPASLALQEFIGANLANA